MFVLGNVCVRGSLCQVSVGGHQTRSPCLVRLALFFTPITFCQIHLCVCAVHVFVRKPEIILEEVILLPLTVIGLGFQSPTVGVGVATFLFCFQRVLCRFTL
jgi:hypothetical protein